MPIVFMYVKVIFVFQKKLFMIMLIRLYSSNRILRTSVPFMTHLQWGYGVLTVVTLN
jgi:hypothetical protein